MFSAEHLCTTCDLRELSPERQEFCKGVAAEIVRQWWTGDPTKSMHDVRSDVLYGGDRPALSDAEHEAVIGCTAEHSLGQCEALAL